MTQKLGDVAWADLSERRVGLEKANVSELLEKESMKLVYRSPKYFRKANTWREIGQKYRSSAFLQPKNKKEKTGK